LKIGLQLWIFFFKRGGLNIYLKMGGLKLKLEQNRGIKIVFKLLI